MPLQRTGYQRSDRTFHQLALTERGIHSDLANLAPGQRNLCARLRRFHLRALRVKREHHTRPQALALASTDIERAALGAQDVGLPGPPLHLAGEPVHCLRYSLTDSRVVEGTVITRARTEAESRARFGRGLAGTGSREEHMASLYIHDTQIDLGGSHLALAVRHNALFADRLATELGKRADHQRIDADQIELLTGQAAFRLYTRNVWPLENQECA